MAKKKNKRVKFEKQLGSMFSFYSPGKKIKAIENNTKHKPKGQR